MTGRQDLELLTHELLGAGENTILLLNGGMMTYAAWAPISTRLGRDHRVLCCDLRGQLRSPGTSSEQPPTRLEDHLPDLVALLDHLRLERVHVMGASFGGEIAVLLSAKHPDRVASLAAVTAADRTPAGMKGDARRARELARQVIDGGDPRHFFDDVVSDLYSPAWRQQRAAEFAARRELSAALPAAWFDGLSGILTAIEDFDLTPVLGDIRCPTLVVHAANDTVMPEPRVRALAASIAGAELRIHPSASHVLIVEDPEWLIEVYRSFLAGVDNG